MSSNIKQAKTQWYRIWSDKWKEQSARWTNPGSNTTWTWTFPKAFSNTNYYTMHYMVTTTSDSFNENMWAQVLAKTSIKYYNSAANFTGHYVVIAMGY